MDKFRIQGDRALEGEIAISGAKNSALPVLAACLLTDEPVKLNRIPPVRDIRTTQQLLKYAGAADVQEVIVMPRESINRAAAGAKLDAAGGRLSEALKS